MGHARMANGDAGAPPKRRSGLGSATFLLALLVAAAAAVTSSTNAGAQVRTYMQVHGSPVVQKLGSSASAFLRARNITIPFLERLLASIAAPSSPCSCGVRRLSGVVDDCCCEYETVDALNMEVLQPLLRDIIHQPFFRYFKVRLYCDCPFWTEDGMCHSRDCSVGECTDEEVPAPLKQLGTSSETAAAAAAAAAVDRTVDRSAFLAWCEDDNPWTHDNETENGEMTYVNLVLNPERYTGYKGDSARRIWQAIYEESCFQDGPNDTCAERRVFYRLISGFHMSITVHVATSFLHNTGTGEVQVGPHLDMFRWRVANFPDRLSNLYFTFLFVLRAAMKASDFLSQVEYDTGNPQEDARTVELMRALVANERLKSACPVPFDEAQLWKGDEGPQLFNTLQQHFRNISAIMDCVGCERCRLWGKLEMLGLATALKILFSVDSPDSTPHVSLQRNEVTALINTLSRFSEALKSTTEMMALLDKESADKAAQQQRAGNSPQSGV